MGLRRPLGIPNPFSQLILAVEVTSNWPALKTFLNYSATRPLRSASRPVFWRGQTRALIPRYRFDALPFLRLASRVGSRYVVRTDISRFYPTLYTHSIPWALHSKPTAKSNRSSSLLGNRLDKWARNLCDGQTVGLPIGPDTSLLLSELVLKGADDELGRLLPNRAGFRFVDDYELPCVSLSEAEDTLRSVEQVLSGFELSLNPRKTTIEELPSPMTTYWADELGRMPMGSTSRTQQRALLEYFTRASELYWMENDGRVLTYAVARLRGFAPLSTNAWRVLQGGILNLAMASPACIHQVCDILVRGLNAGFSVEISALARVLNALICRHAPLGHASEVAWSLWAAIAFGIPLSKEAGDAVVTMDDDVVALLALHADQLGRFSTPLTTGSWAALVTAGSLHDEHWLLAYEAAHKGWLGTTAHIMAEPRFSLLHQMGVSFYDVALASPVLPGAAAPLPGGSVAQVSLDPIASALRERSGGSGGGDYP